MSIHKAQGQTIHKVKVDLGKVFEKGAVLFVLYPAISNIVLLSRSELRRPVSCLISRGAASFTFRSEEGMFDMALEGKTRLICF